MGCLAVAAALVVRLASAQAPPGGASSSPDVTPATPVHAGHVAYPPGAHGDGVVVLDVVVDRDGHVHDAVVVEGEEPFATAAQDAAGAWMFAPARRDGSPVSARVRMRVDFHAPAPLPPAPRSAPAPAPPAPVSPGVAGAPTEVLVRGVRTEVGQMQMGGAEVRQIPGAFGDAFRAIEALPGVTPLVSGLPFFFVRGAPPGNIGYFIDGVRVPLLYHLALGPSVVHPGLIDHVDFFPGGYPARFGRYAGGILAGETVAPAERAHGEANVRLFDSGALVEAPLLDDRMTALVAGRYSYTAATVQLFAPDTRIAYWDYQARVSYRLGPRDSVSLFWFGSFDEVDSRDRSTNYNQDGTVTTNVSDFYPVFKTEFHRLDLRYDHNTEHGQLRLAATLGLEDSVAGSSATQHTGVVASNLRLRAEGEERLTPAMKLRYGSDVVLDHYSIDTGNSAGLDVRSLYPDRNDVTLGAYSDVIWKVNQRVEVVPGLRGDIFTSRLVPSQPPSVFLGSQAAPVPGGLSSSTASVGVDPRIATRVAATRSVAWVTTFGVSHQPPSLFVPIPGLTLGRLNSGLQTALQTSQGVEIALPLDVTLTATAFLHDYLGLSDATATCLGNGTSLASGANDCFAERVNGKAYGIELLIKRDLTRRLTGWISYTLSRSTRETHGIVGPLPGLPEGPMGPSAPIVAPATSLQEIPAEFDRTHVLNVVGALDLGRGWRAGARAVVYTGRPYSPQAMGVPLPPYNSLRLPAFYRFDVRLEKRWRVLGNGSIAFVVEGLNVTLSKEAIAIQCQNDGSLFPLRYDTCSPNYIGPVTVPAIGVEGAI
jgi:TonB family protein